MTVTKKLYFTVGSLDLTGILAAAAGIYYLGKLGAELDNAVARTATKLDLVNATRARSWEMVAGLRGMYFFATLKKQKEMDANAKQWEIVYRRAGEQIREIQPLLDSDQDRSDLARFEAGLEEFGKVSVDYIRLSRQQKFGQVLELMPKVQAFASVADETLTNLKVTQRKSLKTAQARSDLLRVRSLVVSGSLGCVLLAIVVLSTFLVHRMSRTLMSAVAELYEGADQVAVAAGQVSASSQSLAEGSAQQAASLEETSASSQEINSMARGNCESSRTAASLVTKSQQEFAAANRSLEEMVTAMGEIDQSSDKISKVLKVIDEIAFHTNILALNAAVEAARAGQAAYLRTAGRERRHHSDPVSCGGEWSLV